MQQKDAKTELLAKTLGTVITELRVKNKNSSINRFAREYDLDIGNTSRVENGKIDIKFVTLWKISEALGCKTSEIVNLLECRLGKNFHFYEE